MIKVQVRPNEPLEAALRRFKRQCNYAGIFRLAKAHTFHEKRSDKERRIRREQERQLYRLRMKAQQKAPIKTRRKSKVKAASTEGEQNTESTATQDQAIPAKENAKVSEPQPQTGVDISGAVKASQGAETQATPAAAPPLQQPSAED